MNDSFQYGDIIFLGLIAAFILFRLRAMLGKDVGMDPHEVWKNATRNMTQSKISQFADRTSRNKPEEDAPQPEINDPAVASGLRAIKVADPSFSTGDFLAGAKIAFEWVVEAFSKGDKDKLRTVLSEDRFRHFAEEIDARKNEETKRETTLISILSADITEAATKDKYARITVQFTTEQMSVTRDKDNNVVDGNPSQIEHVVDVWTFERDTSSRDPNWKIIAT